MKFYFLFAMIFLLFLIKLASSFNLTCEAGGPYATGSTVIISGNVESEVNNVTSITINISKSGILKISQTTTSDSTGVYFSIFNTPFDIGNYSVNVSANNSTYIVNCSDSFEVMPQEVSEDCEQVTVTVSGVAYSKGKLMASGKLFISIEGFTLSNTTTFSNDEFSISLTACLHIGKEYLLKLSVLDNEGKKGTAYIPFLPV